MHKRKRSIVIPLLTAAALILSGCGGNSTPDIQEILQNTTQEDESSEDGSAVVLDEAAKAIPDETAEATSDETAETEHTICVFVCGAVVSPGVYYFANGDRKVDAVEAAGGFTQDANTSYVNLAELLTDEMQLYIPALGEETEDTAAGTAATETEAAHAGKINLNTASAAELCELSGIGESKAAAILQYREEHGGFETVEELTQVSGIGESTLEKIRDYIYVE